MGRFGVLFLSYKLKYGVPFFANWKNSATEASFQGRLHGVEVQRWLYAQSRVGGSFLKKEELKAHIS